MLSVFGQHFYFADDRKRPSLADDQGHEDEVFGF